MENGGKKIIEIRLYKCGYCENNVKSIIKKSKKEILKFPALVAFIRHQKYGNILFDTGYSKSVYSNGIVSKIYNKFNKTFVDEDDYVVSKLEGNNITNIDKIIISHPHPDHISGLEFFKSYELICTREVFDEIEKHKIKNLVFKNMTQLNYSVKTTVSNYERYYFLKDYFEEAYDILGDGSIWGVRLDGHSLGQMGIYIPEYKLLLAADSCWGDRFIDNYKKMKFIPRKLQDNYKKYVDTIERIKRFKEDYPEVKVIFSHGDFEEGLYGK